MQEENGTRALSESPGEPSTTPSPPPSRPAWKRHLFPWTLLLIGAGLRLAWPLDFEWKGDEQWSFDTAQRTARGEREIPSIGMPSSVGLSNPGVSTWPFVGLAYISRTPEGMTLGVMLINAVWLLGLALWVRFTWDEEDQGWGYWAIALFAVSPLPLLFSRKLWPPDVFPLFLLPWLWAHARRDRAVFAFLWGLIGMLMGQLHLSGFFAAAGLAGGSWISSRKNVHWVAWVWGSVVGVFFMFPWMWHELHAGWSPGSGRTLNVDFLLLAWQTAWGLDLEYSLGTDTLTFLAGPSVAGRSTWLLYGIQTALLVLSIYAAIVLWVERRSLVFPTRLRPLLWGVLIGGGLLQIVCVQVNLYYLIVWSPVFHIMAAWMLSRRPRWLAVTAVLQLCLSVAFLSYIHKNGGARGGDYGVTYRVQQEKSTQADQ